MIFNISELTKSKYAFSGKGLCECVCVRACVCVCRLKRNKEKYRKIENNFFGSGFVYRWKVGPFSERH